MWQKCQGQHVDVWIFNSRTWGRKKLLPKSRVFSVFIFGVTMEKVLEEVYEDRIYIVAAIIYLQFKVQIMLFPMLNVLLLLLLLLLARSTLLISEQLSWFSRQYRSHWPGTSYSLFSHKLSDCTACIKYYCLPHTGRRLSSFELSCTLCGAVPVLDGTSGIIQAVFSCHIIISSSFKSVYFWAFSVMVLWKLWLSGWLHLLSMLLWWFCQA
jgi:hypothetical protein